VSEQILRFADINWAEMIALGEGPVDLCLRKRVAVYIKVQKDCQLVYSDCPVSKDVAFSPLIGFHDGLVFLRLDDDSLSEIASTGYCFMKYFARDGLSIVNKTSTNPNGLNHGVMDCVLAIVEFDRAFLVDRDKWLKRSALWTNPSIPPVGSVNAPEGFITRIEVGKNDLWIACTDIELMREAEQTNKLFPCPLSAPDRMPGIYWMFQAAYACNERKEMSEDAIKKWLEHKAPKGTYAKRSMRTAVKFVRLELNRSRGGKGRGEFVIDDLVLWDARKKYDFKFVSKGLSFIMAIANWWLDIIELSPHENNKALADMLHIKSFHGLEVEDLIYLISGSQLAD
jgi:hypothetical protein